MARITYIEHDGTSHELEVESGLSVMEGAVRNGVPGIDADCGGACACATCHVYIAHNWTKKVGPASNEESDLLEFTETIRSNSRLSCQIEVTAELDGLVVHMPESQR
jgi:2Fe-2S ferredoxin